MNLNLRMIKTYHDNGNPRLEYTVDDQGQIHGTYQSWYENGQLYEQIEYVNGKLHGIRYVWDEDGQLCTQSEYVNGKRHGTYRDWHDNGQLREQSEYVNDNLHGTSRYWYDNGQLWEQCEYVNGARHGIRYIWNDDGSLNFIEQNDNGKELVEVDYMYNNKPRKVVIIKIYDANIETTSFIANITSSLSLEGKKYEIIHC